MEKMKSIFLVSICVLSIQGSIARADRAYFDGYRSAHAVYPIEDLKAADALQRRSLKYFKLLQSSDPNARIRAVKSFAEVFSVKNSRGINGRWVGHSEIASLLTRAALEDSNESVRAAAEARIEVLKQSDNFNTFSHYDYSKKWLSELSPARYEEELPRLRGQSPKDLYSFKTGSFTEGLYAGGSHAAKIRKVTRETFINYSRTLSHNPEVRERAIHSARRIFTPESAHLLRAGLEDPFVGGEAYRGAEEFRERSFRIRQTSAGMVETGNAIGISHVFPKSEPAYIGVGVGQLNGTRPARGGSSGTFRPSSPNVHLSHFGTPGYVGIRGHGTTPLTTDKWVASVHTTPSNANVWRALDGVARPSSDPLPRVTASMIKGKGALEKGGKIVGKAILFVPVALALFQAASSSAQSSSPMVSTRSQTHKEFKKPSVLDATSNDSVSVSNVF